jgi:type 1 glutamine amidotransferase
MVSRINRAVPLVGMAVWMSSISLSGHAYADGSLPNQTAVPLKVLILCGGGDHDWRTTAPVLRRILADSGRFDAHICESPIGLTARTLADFDVLVDDHAGPSLWSESDKAIASFVESGKGIVVTHGALRDSTGSRSTGEDKPASRADAARSVPAYWPAIPTGDQETPIQFFRVKIARTEHPIVRGLTGGFKIADAIPRGLRIVPAAMVIATSVDDAKVGGSGKDEPVLVASSYGKGRVFVTALGHDISAMHENEFIAAFARGTEWAATGTVTIPANFNRQRKDADAVRGLLITGGHDHEAAFYSLFDGYKDLDWLPVDTSATAFKKDLRNKFDVVIMYDFSRDLDDAGKKNLRDFVESGGGVVVLHHALLNYQKWTWWSEDVVGGRYRLDRVGATPSSSVKNDQQIFVTPEGKHAITAGIGPFHITDEAYKNLYMSPKIRPLLTTDNPTSDTNLAWVGPDDKLRVVAIQLGHGHSAFGHPSYRALVHNAVLWAAKKTK